MFRLTNMVYKCIIKIIGAWYVIYAGFMRVLNNILYLDSSTCPN